MSVVRDGCNWGDLNAAELERLRIVKESWGKPGAEVKQRWSERIKELHSDPIKQSAREYARMWWRRNKKPPTPEQRAQNREYNRLWRARQKAKKFAGGW